jgi:hypothetical protein
VRFVICIGKDYLFRYYQFVSRSFEVVTLVSLHKKQLVPLRCEVLKYLHSFCFDIAKFRNKPFRFAFDIEKLLLALCKLSCVLVSILMTLWLYNPIRTTDWSAIGHSLDFST